MLTNNNLETHSNGKERFLVLCILLFAGIIRIPSLTQPIGPDQGLMAVIGEGILHGKLPYRDYWEMASPAIFFTYASMFKLFGTSMAAIPITDTLVSMLTTFLVFLLAKSLWDRRTGYISALFFAFFSNGIRLGMHAGGDVAFGTFWYIAQRETFMLPLLVGSFYLVVASTRHETNSWRLLLSGLLAGLSFAYKFPSLLMFLCLWVYLNWTLLSSGDPMTRLFRKNLAIIFGFLLALVPFVLFFITHGAMRDMTDIIFKYVYSVYGQTQHNALSIIRLGLNRTFFLAQENFILWAFFMTSSIYIILNERTKENLLLVLWGFASVLYVISHKEFFGYHYLMVLPPFSILTGYGIVKTLGPTLKVRRLLTTEIGKTFVITAVLANIFFFSTFAHMHYTKFYFYLTGKITQEAYYDFFTAYPAHDYSFPADYEVSKYIQANTTKKDLIYSVGGIESVIYFLTKRESPSRFIFSWFLFSDSHGRGEKAEGYRKELLDDLRATPPKFIVTVRSLIAFKKFSGIYDFISKHYVLAKTFRDDRYVYQLQVPGVKKT